MTPTDEALVFQARAEIFETIPLRHFAILLIASPQSCSIPLDLPTRRSIPKNPDLAARVLAEFTLGLAIPEGEADRQRWVRANCAAAWVLFRSAVRENAPMRAQYIRSMRQHRRAYLEVYLTEESGAFQIDFNLFNPTPEILH